jgi:hypothetical protein
MESGKHGYYISTGGNNSLPRIWSQGSMDITSLLEEITLCPEYGVRKL